MKQGNYHNLAGHPEVKTLFENFASLTVLQILGYVFPLITLPYLARVIGVSKFGVLAFSSVIISYVTTVVFYGFQFTAVRDISRNKDNPLEISKIMSNVIYSMTFLLTISFIILVSISFFPFLAGYRLILLITFLNVPAQIANFEWFFQGIEKMKYITILSFCSKSIYTISVFFVVKEQSDFVLIPLLLSLSTFLTGFYAFFLIFIRYKVRIHFPGIRNIIRTLKSGWNVFVIQLAPNLYNSFSTVVLKSYYGDFAVGIYDAGRRINAVSEQLPVIFSKATFPFLSRKIDKHKTFMKYNLILGFVISILNLVFAELAIKILYTPEFGNAVWVVKIMAFTPFAYCLINGYGINYLVQVGQEKLFRNIVLICSLLGFGLLYVLIPSYGIYGASVTVVSIFLLEGGLVRYYARKTKK